MILDTNDSHIRDIRYKQKHEMIETQYTRYMILDTHKHDTRDMIYKRHMELDIHEHET